MLLLLVGCTSPKSEDGDDSACPQSGLDACADGLTITAPTVGAWPTQIPVPERPGSFTVGDLEGTGHDTVLLGGSRAATRLDADGGTTALWSQEAYCGVVPVIADVTGDGQADLVLGLLAGDYCTGQVLVFPGPVTAAVSLGVPHFTLSGFPSSSHVANAVQVADLDGDGLSDLLLSSVPGSGCIVGPWRPTPRSPTTWRSPGPAPSRRASGVASRWGT